MCCCIHHVHKVSLQLLYTYNNHTFESSEGDNGCDLLHLEYLITFKDELSKQLVLCSFMLFDIILGLPDFPLTCSLPHPAICYAPCTSTCALGGGSNLMLKCLSLNVVLICNEGGELRLYLWQNHFCCMFSATLLG